MRVLPWPAQSTVSGSDFAQWFPAQPRALIYVNVEHSWCFMVPLHNIARPVTDLDCFTVSLWTGMRLSLGLYCVTFLVVRLPALLPFISLPHISICLWTQFLSWYLSSLVENSFPVTETFRHPFPDEHVEVRPFGLFLSSQEGGGGVSFPVRF